MIRRLHIDLLAVAVLVSSAVGLAGMSADARTSSGSGTSVPFRRLPDPQAFLASHTIRGPRDAPIQIVVFSDYQCPACKSLHSTLSRARTRYPNQIAVVVHHVPLPFHPSAALSAKAGYCAALQGRFEAFDEEVFGQSRIIGGRMLSYAERAGVPDLSQFRACVVDARSRTWLANEIRLAAAARVFATPTVHIGAHQFVGTAPDFETLIAHAVASTSPADEGSRIQ
jgi:protein-disulfide isomerase